MVKPYGSYDVVAVYNLETTLPNKQDIKLESLNLDKSRPQHVWEFRNRDYLGRVRGRLSMEIPPYTVKVYRLTDDTGMPVVLGTDMHVLMGEMEIDRCKWDSTQQTLSGRAFRPAGEHGSSKPKGVFPCKRFRQQLPIYPVSFAV